MGFFSKIGCVHKKKVSRCCPERARAEIHESGGNERGGTDLPTGFARESRYLHPVWGTSGARGRTVGGGEVVALARSAGELDGQAVALELGAICVGASEISNYGIVVQSGVLGEGECRVRLFRRCNVRKAGVEIVSVCFLCRGGAG